MDSVTSLASSATNRYQGVTRTPASGDENTQRTAAVAGNAAQPPQANTVTTVTLSRRAQDLAARQSTDDARSAAATEQSTTAADAAQEARRTQTAQATEQTAQQSDANGARAQADSQLRRAYADTQGSVAR